MSAKPLTLAAALIAGACLITACDKSNQSADGATGAGQVGTAAATGDGTVAATGSADQGGANGTPTNKSVESGMSTSPNGVGASAPPHETAPGAPVSVHSSGG